MQSFWIKHRKETAPDLLKKRFASPQIHKETYSKRKSFLNANHFKTPK